MRRAPRRWRMTIPTGRRCRLPHDWASRAAVRRDRQASRRAIAPRGIGWYRRTLRLDPADRGKTIELQFDGIATNATVWFNGSVVAHNWCGYNSVYIDLTPFARFGDELNVDRGPRRCARRWRAGGTKAPGIYRHAWLVRACAGRDRHRRRARAIRAAARTARWQRAGRGDARPASSERRSRVDGRGRRCSIPTGERGRAGAQAAATVAAARAARPRR